MAVFKYVNQTTVAANAVNGSTGFNIYLNPVSIIPTQGFTNSSRIGDQYMIQGIQFAYSLQMSNVVNDLPVNIRVICGLYR